MLNLYKTTLDVLIVSKYNDKSMHKMRRHDFQEKYNNSIEKELSHVWKE